jgi:hypothetical protein
MNLNVKLSIDEIDVLREAHKFFWVARRKKIRRKQRKFDSSVI